MKKKREDVHKSGRKILQELKEKGGCVVLDSPEDLKRVEEMNAYMEKVRKDRLLRREVKL